MKKINYFLSFISIMLILFGCSQDWLDVNDNPNTSKTATPELLFPSGVVSAGAIIGDYYTLVGGFWSQYWSQSNAANQYKGIDQYQMDATTLNTSWGELYVGALSDLEEVINQSKLLNNNSYLLMATVMKAYSYSFLVDFYSDVPYTNALKGDAADQDFNPTYDNGKSIYDNLLADLDEVLALEYNELTDKQKNADFLFGGDVDEWVKFANTLKLKMFMRQMYAFPSEAEAGVKALYNSGAEFLDSDAALKIFEDAENKDNPLYASNIRKLNVGTNLRISATLYRYLQENGDPRLTSYVQDLTKVNPMPQGGFNIPSNQLDPPSVAVFKQTPVDPVYFISEVESYLLQAEAIAKGWATGDDQELYEAAIYADFTRKGLDTDTLSTLLGPGGVYEYPATGTFEEKQEAIIMAKWVAFAGSQCAEAFFETNRTGFPKSTVNPAEFAWVNGAYNGEYKGGILTYSLEGVTGNQFPKRLNYPLTEVNLNSNFPGQVEITEKVWWDKK